MNEFEKQADAIRKKYGVKAFDYIAASRRDAIAQRDPEMIDHWEAVAKAFQRLDK